MKWRTDFRNLISTEPVIFLTFEGEILSGEYILVTDKHGVARAEYMVHRAVEGSVRAEQCYNVMYDEVIGFITHAELRGMLG